MPKKKKTASISKGIRFPDDVREKIEALATAEHRDITKQVLHLSEEYATDAESLARYRALSAYRGETAFAFPPTVEPEPEPEPPVE